ncbi:MAG: hypothetical protein INF48_01700 [Rhodobacter sp.]|nr:hypothetical protein [Rhodobacter sp.]
MAAPDFDFVLYQLLNGGLPQDRLRIGTIPLTVSRSLGWTANVVMLTKYDAMKIRFHGSHGMGAVAARAILRTLEVGDYYSHANRGTDSQIEVVLHDPLDPKRCHFLVLARDSEDRTIFVRTFYRTNKMSRRKFVGGAVLLNQSGINFFKHW